MNIDTPNGWTCTICGGRGQGDQAALDSHMRTCPNRKSYRMPVALQEFSRIVRKLNITSAKTVEDLLRGRLEMAEKEP